MHKVLLGTTFLAGIATATLAFCGAEPSRRTLSLHQLQAQTATDWASDWLKKELARSPVLLISQSASSSLQARQSLQRACVRFDHLDLDQLGFGIGAAVVQQLEQYNRRQPDSPYLFVGGKLLPENFTVESTHWLQQACYNAGAQFMEPVEGTNMTWTVQKGARWLPPKNIGGRRWYQDDAGMAKYEDEHADPARNLYNELMSSPGGGDALRTRISNPGQMLLRQDAKLDEPDKFGVKKPFPSWGRVDLLLRNVDGVTDYMRSRDVERMRKIKQGQQDEINQYGLPQEVLMWVYGMGRRRLMEELNQRQCHHKVISCIDVQGLREALIEELQNDQAYSPTRQGVTPGVIQKLSTEEFQKERAADTPVPLLLAVVDERSPRHLRFREHLEAAARLLLRSIRVVLVDATQEPEVVRDFSTTRFPTLIWMKGHSGVELAREIGILPATSIVDRTKVLLRLKELPEPEKEASALLAKAGPVSRKIRTSNFERAYPDKHAAVRSLKGHSKGFWRHGRR